MKRFKIWYDIEVIAHDYFLMAEEKGFVITLKEHIWDWFTLHYTENTLSRSENYDFFECVKETNDYIIENNLDRSKIEEYPEIYKYINH